MLIAFVHNHRSFMPEVDAYRRFFMQKGFEVVIVHPQDLPAIRPAVEWHMMGTHWKRIHSAAVIIHEYTSASAPPFRQLKDIVKRTLTVKPHYRLFLNDFVRSALGFSNTLPAGLRDMFVISGQAPLSWQPQQEKEFDFIYMGNLHKTRRLSRLFNLFTTGPLRNRSLLVLSKDYESLQSTLQPCSNIVFEGPVSPFNVGHLLQRCRFGINYMPDEAPFNQQTSTKVLEYAAHGLPVISTSYAWIRQFESTYGARFFYMEKDFSNCTWEQISRFHYQFPDLSEWTLEKQLERSGVLTFLQSKFPSSSW
jgi:hypothetical protein